MLLGSKPAVGTPASPRVAGSDAWQFPVTIACVLLGMLITVQFKTQRSVDFPLFRQSDQLQRMVKSLESNNEELSRGVRYLETDRNKLLADLKETRDQLQRMEGSAHHSGDQALVQGLKDDLGRARMLAGLVPVKGPGVEVELNDSPRTPGPNDDPYFFLIHDLDIQAFVNELWAAGAEGVAVNDQRLATSSSVRCVGPTVLVNTVRLAPPYVIRAIGDPRTLETALRMPGGVINNMENQVKMGVRISITRSDRPLVLPEFKGASSFRYLQPATDADVGVSPAPGVKP
jgi:uncharacterized protein YlxW (UPF0749 family)